MPRILKIIDDEDDRIQDASFFDIKQNNCVKYEGVNFFGGELIDMASL